MKKIKTIFFVLKLNIGSISIHMNQIYERQLSQFVVLCWCFCGCFDVVVAVVVVDFKLQIKCFFHTTLY